MRVFRTFENIAKGVISKGGPWVALSWETTSAAFGIYTAILAWPQALRYNGSNNRTYIAYQDNVNCNPYILYYDHGAASWSAPVNIGSNPIGPDDHGPPVLAVDGSGFIYSFYGAHDSAIKVKKANGSESIAAWTAKTDVAAGSYPRPRIRSGGTIQVFYRGVDTGVVPTQYPLKFAISTDGATTWTTTNLVAYGANFAIYGSVWYETDSKIHVAYMQWPNVNSATVRLNCYYLKSTDGGTTWTKADGTSLSLPVDDAHAEKVFDSGANECYVWDLKVDSNGAPVIVFNTGPTLGSGTYKCARWNGSSWDITTITTTHYYLNSCCLDVKSPTNFDCYLTRSGVPSFSGRGGQMERWSTQDTGATWTLSQILTPGCNYKSFAPQMVKDYSNDLRMVWGLGGRNPSNIAFYGDAVANVPLPEDVLFETFGNIDDASTTQVFSGTYALKVLNGSWMDMPSLGTLTFAQATPINIRAYFSATSGDQARIALRDSGGNQATDTGAFLKFQNGSVFAFNGSSYIDTTLTFTTGWNLIKIIPGATTFDLTVNGVAKLAVVNRNTISDIQNIYLEGTGIIMWFDDVLVGRRRSGGLMI